MARKEVRERLRDRPASAAARSRKRRDPVDLGSQRSEFTALRDEIQLVTDFRWFLVRRLVGSSMHKATLWA
jgi:hypothetical protein